MGTAAELGRQGQDGTKLGTLTASAVLGAEHRPVAVCMSRPASAELAESLHCRRTMVSAPPSAESVLLLVSDDNGTAVLVDVPLDRPEVSWRPVAHIAEEPRNTLDVAGLPSSALNVLSLEPDWLLADALRHGAYLCGLAEGALGHAVGRVRRRRQFGAPVGTNQSVAFALAAASARVAAAAALGRALADQFDRGALDAEEAAGWWDHTASLARDVTELAVHLHGTHGLTSDSSAQRHYRLACLHTAAPPVVATTSNGRQQQ
jgi:alkylation response protein AidB-like acyl-CoA dehydrogenase